MFRQGTGPDSELNHLWIGPLFLNFLWALCVNTCNYMVSLHTCTLPEGEGEMFARPFCWRERLHVLVDRLAMRFALVINPRCAGKYPRIPPVPATYYLLAKTGPGRLIFAITER